MRKNDVVDYFARSETGRLVYIKWRIRYWHYVETRSALKTIAPEVNLDTDFVCKTMLLPIIRVTCTINGQDTLT